MCECTHAFHLCCILIFAGWLPTVLFGLLVCVEMYHFVLNIGVVMAEQKLSIFTIIHLSALGRLMSQFDSYVCYKYTFSKWHQHVALVAVNDGLGR